MKSNEKKENDWECDSAVDTLLRAEKIKKDPELMKRVQKSLSEKSKEIKSLKDLKRVSNAAKDEDYED